MTETWQVLVISLFVCSITFCSVFFILTLRIRNELEKEVRLFKDKIIPLAHSARCESAIDIAIVAIDRYCHDEEGNLILSTNTAWAYEEVRQILLEGRQILIKRRDLEEYKRTLLI